ncbi:hypothetical protein BGW80DRAFT_1560539 [Lactifluus volemus]|nr:hypothetical protein BGW80DRAFT_1560539 [Lactifluus volemus]
MIMIRLLPFLVATTRSSVTFNSGGIVPTTSPFAFPFSPNAPTTFSSSSFNLGGVVSSSSPNPAFTPVPNPVGSNGPSEFTTTGANGLATVLLLSTVTLTVTDAACSTPLVFIPQPALSSPLASSPAASPFFLPAASSASPTNINAQTPSAASASSFSIIDLNVPSSLTPTPAAVFSFSSAPASSVTPAPSPANVAPPANCDLSCQLTASV